MYEGRNPAAPYGSVENEPEVGDTVFRLGVMLVVRHVTLVEARPGVTVGWMLKTFSARRGLSEWMDADRFELVRPA